MQTTGILKPVKLPYMQTFCIYYSVRFGVIVIGIFTMIQSVLFMVALGFALQYPNWVSSSIDELIAASNHVYFPELFQDIAAESKVYVISLYIFFLLLLISCISLIIGAYKCQDLLTYLFIGTYFMYATTLVFVVVLGLLSMKEMDYNLGVLSVCSIIAAFALLFIYYKWFCVLSFCQILKQLNTQMAQLTTLYTSPQDRNYH